SGPSSERIVRPWAARRSARADPPFRTLTFSPLPAKSPYARCVPPLARRRPAHPRSPDPDPPHAPAPPQEAGHGLPGPGRLLRQLHPPLRPPLLPLPPRRAPAHRPAPDLQRTRQDPLGLRPPRPPARGPHMAGRTPAPQGPAPRDP